jgi:hypothetical protein
MRRLIGALLCLALWTSTAHAKALVIVHESAAGTNAQRAVPIQEGLVLDLLRETGGYYDAVRSGQFAAGVTVQNLRRGKYFNGIDTVTYNPIIHVGYVCARSTSFDSLTMSRNFPMVSHVFIGNHGADNGAWANSSACSVGVSAAAGSSNDSAYVTYRVGDPGKRWVQENSGGPCPVTSTRLTNGWRPIWGMSTTARAFGFSGAPDDPLSGAYSTNPDSVCLWSILNVAIETGSPLRIASSAPAVPMVFAMPTYKYAFTAGEMSVYAAALALADSLSGGGLYPNATRKLAKIAIHIDDGWKRGDSRNGGTVYGGIEVRDTTLFKASIDSLAALGVPLTLGVEIDSLTSCWLDTTTVVDSCYTVGSSTTLHTKRVIKSGGGNDPYSGYFYPTLVGKKCSIVDGNGNYTTVVSVGVDSTLTLNTAVNITMNSTVHTLFWDSTAVGNAMLYDGRWWARAPQVHYTPHCHSGTTTVKGQFQQGQSAAGPYWRMMDIWGTNSRVRTAWGGGTGLGRDSTFSILAKRAFWLLDSTFGAGKVDHVAMPPGDDWTPTYNSSTGVGNWPIPMTLDSLIFAWDFAGGRGIRNNSASNASLVSIRLGSYGMYTGTMDYTVGLTATGATDRRGARGRFVSCPSYPTTASLSSYSRLAAGKGIRAFNSALNGHTWMVPGGSSSTSDEYAKAQVLAIHCSDLGGNPSGSPTRPGYYCIKYPVMASKAINALARQDVIRFVYPEELCP